MLLDLEARNQPHIVDVPIGLGLDHTLGLKLLGDHFGRHRRLLLAGRGADVALRRKSKSLKQSFGGRLSFLRSCLILPRTAEGRMRQLKN